MTTNQYVARLVASAPPPTTEQLTLVRGLLGPNLASNPRSRSSRREAA